MGYQYSQGALVTITITTTDQYGNPVAPDNLMTPLIDVNYVTPDGDVNIISQALMTPITASFYYFNIDSSTLATGSYNVTGTAIVGGSSLQYPQIFDIVAGNGFTLLPVDPISRLRMRLKDNDPNPIKWVWTDMELSEYLQGSLDEFNMAPPRSNFYWMNVPLACMTNILKGAEISAMEANAIKVAHQPITYNDKGITVNLLSQAATYQNIARELREQQEKERLRIKRQMYPKSGFITTPDSPYMSYPPIRATDRRWGW
jgi:hypothetical protein